MLVHGLGGSAERWLGVIPNLSQKYRVIAIDLIGFGYSDKPSEDYTVDFFARFLTAFIKKLGLTKVVLVGTSMGGQIAAECAGNDPSVERLVLVAPSGAMKSTTKAVEAYMMAALYPNSLSAREALEMMTNASPVEESAVADFVKRMSMPNAKLAFMSSVLGIKNSSIEATLQRIKVPTLLVWGRQDKVIPIIHAGAFAGRIKDCTFLPLEGQGHLPHVENPAIFSKFVLEFLNSRLVVAESP